MITLQKKTEEHNPNWPQILDHLYTMLIIGSARHGKTNTLLNLIKQQNEDDYNIIDKIYLYVEDPIETKYQYFIKNMKKLVLKSSKIQILLLNIQIICRMSIKILKNTAQIENKVLPVFDDMIADMISNKKI